MRKFGVIVLGMALAGGSYAARADGSVASTGPAVAQTASREIAAAAVKRSMQLLSAPGGFYLTPKYHIPLAKTLDKAVKTLDSNYATSLPDAVERSINRAAEAAAVPAGDYVLKALPTLALPEAAAGADDAVVTAAIKTQIGAALKDAMRPVIKVDLEAAGGQAAMHAMQTRYEQLSNTPLQNFDVEDYALDNFVSTFFASVAAEEQNIRARPSLRTTDALQRVFSQK